MLRWWCAVLREGLTLRLWPDISAARRWDSRHIQRLQQRLWGDTSAWVCVAKRGTGDRQTDRQTSASASSTCYGLVKGGAETLQGGCGGPGGASIPSLATCLLGFPLLPAGLQLSSLALCLSSPGCLGFVA